MKIENKKKTIVAQGFGETNSVPVEVSGTLYEILSDGFYQDNIMAILRELGTNAWDAHKAAGNNDPFYVHLPTWDEPHFAIRDYGTGLKDILDLITYAKSTKRDSNDAAGCFGLGSKTPFSYTDQYVITSWCDGQKIVCLNYKNEDEIPQYTILVNEPSDEPNGVEIKFDCQDSDFRSWQDKFKKAYQYFDIKPKNNLNIVIEDIEYTTKESGAWGIYGHPDSWGSAKIKGIMGPIGYDIQVSELEDVNDKFQFLRGLNVDLFFDIGDLSITTSRERVKYTKKTKRTIIERLKEMSKKLVENIQKEIDEQDDLWQARCYALTALTSANLQSMWKTITYKGKLIDPDGLLYGSSLDWYTYCRAKNINIAMPVSRGFKNKTDFISRFPLKETSIYLKDSSNWRQRIIHEVGDYANFYYLDNEDQKQEFCNFTGMDPNGPYFLSTEDLESPPKKTGIKRGRTQKISKFNPKNSDSYIWSDQAEVDDNDGVFYLPAFRYKALFDYRINKKGEVHDHGVQIDKYTINQILEALKMIGYEVPDLYGVKKSEIPKIRKNTNWRRFDKYAINKIKDYVDKNRINVYNRRYSDFEFKHIQEFAEYDDELAKIIQNVKHQTLKKFDDVNNMLRKINLTKTKKSKYSNFVEVIPQSMEMYNVRDDVEHLLSKKYPLLPYISSGTKPVEYIKHYIKLIQGEQNV